jgi:hypothetical protein
VRTSANEVKSVKLKFGGLQETGCGYMPLWHLLEPIEASDNGGVGFIESSTLSEATLKRCGYFVPNPTGWQIGQEFLPKPVVQANA